MIDWILRKQTAIDSGAASRDSKPEISQQGKLKEITKSYTGHAATCGGGRGSILYQKWTGWLRKVRHREREKES